jgi:CelD/BcsL family acetyltransferase involved in cellulose biosynthesis
MTTTADLRKESRSSQFGTVATVLARDEQFPAASPGSQTQTSPRSGSAGTLDAPGGFDIAKLSARVARTEAEIQALASAWTALEKRCATPTFFQSYAWCGHVMRTLTHGPDCGPLQPFVLTAWRNETLVAVWPLQMRRESGALVLTDLTDPFAQYADVLLAGDDPGDSDQTCRWLIAQARRLSGADALMLRKVRHDTPLGRVLAATSRVLDAPQRAPFVSMASHATFEAYHGTAKAKTRKNVRNAMNRLEKLGKLTHRVERRSARMDAALVHCFDLRSTWLERRGLTSTAFAHPAFAALVQGLADPVTHDIDVLSMMLMLDEQPISIHYGFLHNRRYYAFMAARNPDFDACSPGKVHLEYVLAACHAYGVETVDLLAPIMAYKHAWASGEVEVSDFGTTWSLRGWLAIDIWRRRVRPLSRSAFLALPDGLRQKIVGWYRAPKP